ncbi:MAG TPA: hypothetical protein VF230_04535 [Acidimicrobiales bacterium]
MKKLAVLILAVTLGGCGAETTTSARGESAGTDNGADNGADNGTNGVGSVVSVPGRAHGMRMYDYSNVAELAEIVEGVAVVKVTSQRTAAIGRTGFTISTAEVVEPLKGQLAVGQTIDVRQMGARDGGSKWDFPIIDVGATYVAFLADMEKPSDRQLPYFHVFGLYGADGHRWKDLEHEPSLPADETRLTLDQLRRRVVG